MKKLSKKGFTLIELLVVVALIALISAMVMPSVSSYFQVSLNSATRDLSSVVKESYNSTVLTGRAYRVVYDFKKAQYWAESGPSNVLLDTEASKKKAEDRARHSRTEENAQTDSSNSFALDKTITRKKVDLPRGVTFEDVLTEQSKDPIKEGMAYTHFFPQGMTEQTIIHLVDSSNHHVSLVISPLVGKSDVYDRYVTSEEVFGKKQSSP
jgi:prepilin-type N-terminal cleavage/methylation domain-containing protein